MYYRNRVERSGWWIFLFGGPGIGPDSALKRYSLTAGSFKAGPLNQARLRESGGLFMATTVNIERFNQEDY